MRIGIIVFSGLLAAGMCTGQESGLEAVKSVYLLPMTNGFDQYLASRLTRAGVFAVVTDPQRADAVFTDRLGPAFESRLNDLYPPPKPNKPPETKEAPKKDEEKATTGLNDTTSTGATPITSLGRSKGTLFLVGVKSHAVLWSAYERPKDSSSRQLDRTAGRVADQLADALNPKKK